MVYLGIIKRQRDIMNNEMATLIESIKADYLAWQGDRAGVLTDINKKMIAEFDEGLSYKTGSKYIKITKERGGVWGFVVKTDNDKKFKKGDILKAAGYAAPARNFARGNILAGGYTVRWTGAF